MGITSATIFAGEVGAGAGTDRAVFPGEAKSTRAGVVIGAIQARPAVLTGVAGTVVDVGLAAGSSKTGMAMALDTVFNIQTLGTISTWVAAASVKFLLAVGASEARRAPAAVATGSVFNTGPAVKTGPLGTRHGTDLTVLSIETLWACAGVIIHQILPD